MGSSEERRALRQRLTGTIERLVEAVGKVDARTIAWRPAADANSIFVLAVHTIGQAEENVVEVLGGEPVGRDRDAEFAAADAAAATVRARWAVVRPRLERVLDGISEAEWERERDHPRLKLAVRGRDIALIATTHAAEHLGHVELTAQWARAAGMA